MVAQGVEEIRTVCYMCYGFCGIRVGKRAGTVVEISGDAGNPHNQGKLCAKGIAGIMSLYDPYRLKVPLLRTNREKGPGVDPKWEEISWQEALDIIVGHLKQIRDKDPRELILGGQDFQVGFLMNVFAAAFGTPNVWRGGINYFCGNGLHPVLYLTNAAFFAEPDFEHCNFLLLFGTQMGFMVNTNATTLAGRMAQARCRGMKLVVVDPVGTNAAAKADEWLPIRPGTDAALALGLANIMVNHLGIYDTGFLSRHTNAPYLVGADGLYLRDPPTHKPLIWDLSEERAKPFDAAEIKEPALQGDYLLNAQKASPAFELLKKHLLAYSPAEVSRVTTIPEQRILSLAEEFGQRAQVGSSILLGGHQLPYRPACAAWNRGAIAHKHGMLTGLAIQLLNSIVGALDVPGGLLGCNPVGPFWAPTEGPEGLIIPADLHLVLEPAYPARPVSPPQTVEARELFPVASYASPMFEEVVLNPERFQFPYRPKMLMNFESNPLMSSSSPKRMAEVIKKIPFLVTFAKHLDETAELADIVLPDASYLERMVPFPNRIYEQIAAGPGPWFWALSRPVAQPPGQARPWVEVILELVERLGITREFNVIFNSFRKLKEPYRLDAGTRYRWPEMVDLWAKGWCGPDHGLDWFAKHSLLRTREKRIEEAFSRPFLKAKIPIYGEHFLAAGHQVKRVTQAMGLNWDTSDYQPLPDWKPCPGYRLEGSDYDLYAVNYKLPFHTFSYTVQNPWLNELAEHHPAAYKVLINAQTAARKGIKQGDVICLESAAGTVRGLAQLSQCIHPECVALAGTFGHQTEGMPVAKAKGVHFNSLLTSARDDIDMVSAALDCCVRVKVHTF